MAVICNLNRKWITICCWSKICSSMLLQARCHCISGVGVSGRMWSGRYIHILNLPTMYAAVYAMSHSVKPCIVRVKYCNHLLAVDMAGVA